MASIARSALLRQTAALSAPASRFSTVAAVRTAASPSMALRQKQTQLVQNASRIAAFHASSRRNLLPPGPQVVHGTVNDAAPVPHSDPSHGSYHWTFERLLAAGLVPLSLAPFAAGSLNPTTDAILAGAILLHAHLSFSTIVVDYVPTGRYHKTRIATTWALNTATVLVGLGLYEFETNDVGITELISRLWKA